MAFSLWSLTLVIWVLVSILCATAAIFAFMQPFWVVNHVARKSFGLYGFCAHNEAENKLESSPWLDPLTGSIVDVIVVDGGGFEVVDKNATDFAMATIFNSSSNLAFNFSSIQHQLSTTTTAPSISVATVTSCGHLFGTYFHFSEWFTIEPVWKAVGSLYAIATAFLCIAAIISVVVMFLSEFDLNVRRLCRIAGVVQLSALGLFVMSIVIFPAIMTSPTAGTFCPQQSISVDFPPPIFASTMPPPTTSPPFPATAGESSSALPSDQCHFGWAFVLASMNTLIVLFLPILSHFVVTEPDTLGDLKITNL